MLKERDRKSDAEKILEIAERWKAIGVLGDRSRCMQQLVELIAKPNVKGKL